MDSLPIPVPVAPLPPRRPQIPIVAAIVPVIAGVGLWLVTGSLFSLCFAALGPLMILASLLDGARAQRKTGRQAADEYEARWAVAEEELARRHSEERELRRHRSPDVACCLAQPPLRGPEQPDAATELVIGSGSAPSAVRASGGEGERERDFHRRCATIDRVPVGVPIGGGVAVRGAAPVTAAVVRGLVVQLCLRFGPATITVVGEAARWGLAGLPHAARSRRGAFRIGVARPGDDRVDADAVMWMLAPGEEVPPGITTVLDVSEPRRVGVRTPQGLTEVAIEGLSDAQARAIALQCDAEEEQQLVPDALGLEELEPRHAEHGLPAALGRGLGGDVVLDLVADGPHAIVTGTTGAGKSELLVSWVSAIAERHGPERVTFVLADFKGGTAFEPLKALPQVSAVITDLDEAGARRGVSSLTAELRRRESVLAAQAVRDVRETDLPRLVIVVDEFAALLHEHGDLGAVFTDIAARGRALGMHLVIGTQRATGVIRDALAANCPLRVSLRVAEAADSRMVIGTDAAAELPGGVESRGLALVRRPQDVEPAAMRVALTSAADLRRIGRRWSDSAVPDNPWLPPLPTRIPLSDLLSHENRSPGAVILGRADDPERQRQPLELLRVGADRGLALVGAPGSGRTTALRALARQTDDALWISRDPEEAWDAVAALAERPGTLPPLILCDDLDIRIAELPAEYGQHLAHLWERILRGSPRTTFVVTAARSSGPVARLLDALPRRGLLRTAGRVEHLAAGGDAQGWVEERVPGRARLGGREVQIAWVPEDQPRAAPTRRHRRSEGRGPRAWGPRDALTAVVTTGSGSVAEALRGAYPDCVVRLASEPADPPADDRPLIIVGESEMWQRSWALWQRIRGEGEVLIRPENPADLRQLAGVRELPPFARTHAGRAWSLTRADPPQRVLLPALAPR